MGLKLEVGKYYRDAEGRKVGPLRLRPSGNFDVEDGSASLWTPDGHAMYGVSLIALWQDAPTGPVRTVTRTTREIVPGVYGATLVDEDGFVVVMPTKDVAEIRAAIDTLTEIADALEEGQ